MKTHQITLNGRFVYFKEEIIRLLPPHRHSLALLLPLILTLLPLAMKFTLSRDLREILNHSRASFVEYYIRQVRVGGGVVRCADLTHCTFYADVVI